jgi:hypothetical protein
MTPMSLNRYTYGFASPLVYWDPDGRFAQLGPLIDGRVGSRSASEKQTKADALVQSRARSPELWEKLSRTRVQKATSETAKASDLVFVSLTAAFERSTTEVRNVEGLGEITIHRNRLGFLLQATVDNAFGPGEEDITDLWLRIGSDEERQFHEYSSYNRMLWMTGPGRGAAYPSNRK